MRWVTSGILIVSAGFFLVFALMDVMVARMPAPLPTARK
jgi:hypothetical protein